MDRRKGQTDTFCQFPTNEGASARDVKTCKHYCNTSYHWCVWLQCVCDGSSDLCVYEYNNHWRTQFDMQPIQLSLF